MQARTLVLALAAALATRLPAPAEASPAAAPPAAAHAERAVLAGGCFWGMEAVFESLRGVSNVVAGYAGGAASTATYDQVSTGQTGHAESVLVTFDPAKISYEKLLEIYFSVAHDPTQADGQGADRGTQYRSAIFYADPGQKRAAEAAIRKLTAQKKFAHPIVTQVVKLDAFYPAEAYHQHFVRRNPDDPYVVFVDLPKLKELRVRYPDLVKP